jgi:hypothetical protein
MHLPTRVPEPAAPPLPEPPPKDLRAAQIQVARVLKTGKVGTDGIRAPLLAHLVVTAAPYLCERTAEWAIYQLLGKDLLRLVLPRSVPDAFRLGGGVFASAPVGVPLPVGRFFVPFPEQVIAPTAALWEWWRDCDLQGEEGVIISQDGPILHAVDSGRSDVQASITIYASDGSAATASAAAPAGPPPNVEAANGGASGAHSQAAEAATPADPRVSGLDQLVEFASEPEKKTQLVFRSPPNWYNPKGGPWSTFE